MGWFSGLAVFALLWWVLFLASLPWGIRTASEAGHETGAGHATSAPVKPRLWLKIGIVTLVAALLWGAIDFVILEDLISFRTTPGEVWGK